MMRTRLLGDGEDKSSRLIFKGGAGLEVAIRKTSRPFQEVVT